MAFNYEKEYREFYMRKNKPSIVEVPTMKFISAIPVKQRLKS